MRSNQQGFTLIEVLLSSMIISALVALSLPLYQSFQTRNDLDITTQGVASSLRRAQVYARSMSGDSTWSVRVQSGSAVLFKGSTYASRDAEYDEPTTIPTSFSATGITDITFAKLTALPTTTGSITLTSPNNETRTITINAEGMVNY